MNATDYLKAAASSVILTLSTLAWVHISRQTSVARTFRSSLAIAIRIALIHAVTIPVIRAGTGCSIDFLAIPLVVILLLLPFAKHENLSGVDMGSLALAVIFMLPVYILKQFVLGFPDQKEFILAPPPQSISHDSHQALLPTETTAIVVTPLRPFGYVELNGNRVAAASIDGLLIEKGMTVDVIRRQNTTLLVQIRINSQPQPESTA